MSSLSVLEIEPVALPFNQVYSGGSSPGVQCANCRSIETSGSWRRGWEVQDRGNANLCNRCGQQWVKMKKRAALGQYGPIPGPSLPPPRPRLPQPLQPTAIPSVLKRPLAVNESSMLPHENGYIPYKRNSMTAPRPRLPSETNTISETSEISTAMDSPAEVQTLNAQQSMNARDDNAPRGYCVQKMNDGRVTYALFWVVGCQNRSGDGAGKEPLLAAVGIDSRSSGHFTYTATPMVLTKALPLRCTNRAEVIAWMVSMFGAGIQIPESVAKPPLLTISQLFQLLDGENRPPLLLLPKWQQKASAMISDGSESDEVAVSAAAAAAAASLLLSDSISFRRPSRINLGAKIKPGGSSMAPPHSELALTPIISSSPAMGLRTATAFLRLKCSACGRDDHSTDDCYLNCASPPTLIHNPASNMDICSFDDMLLLPLTTTTITAATATPAKLGVGRTESGVDSLSLDLDVLLMGDEAMQETAFDSFLEAAFGALRRMTSHEGEGVAVAAAAKPGVDDGAGAALAEPMHIDGDDDNDDGDHRQRKQQLQPSWVNSLTPQELEDTFKSWAAALRGHITDAPPPPLSVSSSNDPGAVAAPRWVPVGEALAIMHQLSTLDVSMGFVERTEIARAVAMLRQHSNRAVAVAAGALSDRWHTKS